MDRLISVAEAVQRLQQAARPMPGMEVSLEEACTRVLAEDIVARLDMPPFPRAMLDGFAVQAGATQSASREHPVILPVAATVAAGCQPQGACDGTNAYRTMTGAPMAEGADAIVRIEHAEETVVDGRRYVRLYKEVQSGEAVQPQAHDMVRGDVILSAGQRIGAVEMGVLAMNGYKKLSVRRLPRVAVVATGSEVAESADSLRPGRVYDANTPLLTGLMARMGLSPVSYPPVSDNEKELSLCLRRALEDCDVLVTTGGVSVGDFDLVPSTLERLGVERLFWGVRMRPGTPVYAGRYGSKPVIALSGNPAAAYVNAHLFLLPVLDRLTGALDSSGRIVYARMKQPPKKRRANLTRFLRGKLVFEKTGVYIEFSPEQSAGTLWSFVGMTGLAQVDPGVEISEGALVPVHVMLT